MNFRDLVDSWGRKRWFLVLVLMLTYSAQSILITASKSNGTGGYSYDASAAVFLAELLKLLFALAMLSPVERSSLDISRSYMYAVPAILYTAQNRLVFEALRCISPPQYQLLNNMKLFTTSIVYRLAFKRQLTMLQWLALLLLGLGMALATVPTSGLGQSSEGNIVFGTGIMVAVSWCSASASVMNEWLIKNNPSPMEANVWLYAYGIVAGLLQMFFLDSGEEGPGKSLGLLRGFGSISPWLVVLCNAVLGQSIAFLLKYANSIVKLYAVCAAMAFTALISWLLFGFELTFHAVTGYVIAGISMSLYYAPIEILAAKDSDVLEILVSGWSVAKASEKGKQS
eukprot:TRINITY_DN17308_c0_g5_i1.p1 TRINITY_DN17308_c0_g5~~TRINITY_DN17308_c0_g5_i1.p1  ORF type:complete len:341 (+),score=37.79 TRINITY_DN17308_c0_g5_i1:90-1112(+)